MLIIKVNELEQEKLLHDLDYWKNKAFGLAEELEIAKTNLSLNNSILEELKFVSAQHNELISKHSKLKNKDVERIKLKKIYEDADFIQVLENAISPFSFNCAYTSSAVKLLEGDKTIIYSFSTCNNQDAKFFIEKNGSDSDEGHYFAVKGQYIIDPWMFDRFHRSVFDMFDSEDVNIIKYLYGHSGNWVEITHAVECFKENFPETHGELLKSYIERL